MSREPKRDFVIVGGLRVQRARKESGIAVYVNGSFQTWNPATGISSSPVQSFEVVLSAIADIQTFGAAINSAGIVADPQSSERYSFATVQKH